MQPDVPALPCETPCYGVACVEGIPDCGSPERMFLPGSLTFAPTPFPIKWQRAEEEGHEGSVVVGRVDAIWRDGSLIRWIGCMDTGGADGAEVTRQIEGGFVRGISVKVDDVDSEDVEIMYMPDAMPMPDMPMPGMDDGAPDMSLEGGESFHPGHANQQVHGRRLAGKGARRPRRLSPSGSPIHPPRWVGLNATHDAVTADGMMEMDEPCDLVFHAARVRSITICAEPAFVECTISLGDSPFPPPIVPDMPEPAPIVAAAVASHNTATSDAPWDGPAAEKALPSPMPIDTARAAYAWIDDSQEQAGQIPKTGGRFIHHEVSADGTPGAANIKACQSAIGVLNGGRGGTTIPAEDMSGVHAHLAAHLKDAGLDAPPMGAATAPSGPKAITAGAYTITIPDIWPESWFEAPPEQPPFGALHITASGRVYGLLAPSRVDHRAFRASGQRVQAPRNVDYSEFMNKPCIVAGADGQVYRINAGSITFNCGHASPVDPRRADPVFAIQHYENSCSVAARVRVGENEHGTWVAGALLHGIDAPTVERMMACALSGDWQAGKLNAALLVPVEGFPTRVAASVRVREDALVSSSVPIQFDEPEPGPDYEGLFDLIASATGRGPQARFAELAAERFDEIARERNGG